ncbi:DHA3 family macrolide efflux protein-like MFS transporter [Aequitasia blattaphilus]|uniref:MFS transporter n=1 Tax=Aequitasia blattaphilus TaxID=2949332 RepID=A0ABT1E5X0_9FIRM|nr:MFS transporter [Aequitasia blattaphilus]MCP1101148.1 MFS transporter [Aequitasia blattaphilus]MCR8613788.1 MFS transporter [Aequitasia blattaphilus]
MSSWKKRFVLLGIGQGVSMLTSSILQISIVWYLTKQTGSATIVTFSTLAGFLPRAVLGMFTGTFIDKFNRKAVLILSDFGIALAAIALSIVAKFGVLPIWFIFLILGIRSAGAAFHTPSLNAIVPSIVPKTELARCAGILQGFESVSLILSPAIGSVLYGIWSLSSIVLLDVVGALAAITIVFFLKIPRNIEKEDQGGVNILKDTKEGIQVLRKEKGMMTVLIIGSLYALIYFPIGSLYPLITMTYFNGSVTESGIVEIIFSGGTLLGSLLLGIWGNRVHKILAIAASIGVYGVGAFLSGMLSPNGLYLFMVFSGMMGLTIPFFYGLRTAIFQSRIPDEFLGRVLSLVYSAGMLAGPIGLIFGGRLAETVGVNNLFRLCGILAISLAMVMVLMPSVRKSIDLPKKD